MIMEKVENHERFFIKILKKKGIFGVARKDGNCFDIRNPNLKKQKKKWKTHLILKTTVRGRSAKICKFSKARSTMTTSFSRCFVGLVTFILFKKHLH